MFRPPPSSLLEALQQIIGSQGMFDSGTDQSLFAAPMMPQEPSNSFPQGSIQNMDPNALSALEQGLSSVMTNKANLEDAAMQEGRGDLFVNQAMNDPERAPMYMAKSELAEGQRREKVQGEEMRRQEAMQMQGAQAELTSKLLPSVGPEVATAMARKLMNGEEFTNEDIAMWQNAKFEQERKAFDMAKQSAVGEAMMQHKELLRDASGQVVYDMDGKPQYRPVDMSNKEEITRVRSFYENQFGTGPQAPTPPPTQTSGAIVERTDPKTGKTIYSNQPIKPKGAIPEKPPMTLVSDTPPKTPPKSKTTGGLTSKIAEFQKPIEKGFKGGYRSPFENKERDKQTMGTQIALEILTKGIRTGRTPQQTVAEAKLDKSIPPEILKLIEQYSTRM